MKIFSPMVIAAFLSACAAVSPYEIETSDADLRNHEVHAFVGNKISVNSLEPEIVEGCIAMDAAFLATYEVLDQYSGEELPNRVQSKVYGHYGFPDFARSDSAMVSLKRVRGTSYHIG